MEIRFFEFYKKTNSTKRPSLDDTNVLESCELKNISNILAPNIVMKFDNSEAPTWNYCYIPDFHRYYFIDSWTWENGLWSASLSVDALATYKYDINNADLYVLRSGSIFDGSIIDTLYPAKTGRVGVCNSGPNPYYTNWYSGFYVVGIVNGDLNSVGATSFYVMTPENFRNLMSYLFSSVNYLDISTTELSESLQKALVNPFQYIVSAMYFPTSIPAGIQNEVTPIPIGWWAGASSGYSLNATHFRFEHTILIPKHPQAVERGVWLNDSPYSTYSLEYFPYGSIALDSNKMISAERLKLSTIVDLTTGVGNLRVTPDNNDAAIAVATAQIGVPIQLAQMSIDFGNLATGIGALTAAAGVGVELFTQLTSQKKSLREWLSPDAFKDIEVNPSGLTSAINSTQAEVSISGTTGGMGVFSLALRVNGHFAVMADDDLEHFGRPLCDKRKLGDLQGYCQTQSGDIALSNGAFDNERKIVKAYLEGGLFLE